MKILLVSSDFPPEIGGIANHVDNLSFSLTRLGHEVEVVVMKTNSNSSHSSRHRIDLRNGVKVHFLDSRFSKYRLIRFSRQRKDIQKFLKTNQPFSIIHVHDYRASFKFLTVYRRNTSRLVVTHHSSEFLYNCQSWYQRVLDRFFLRLVDEMISPSEELRLLSLKVISKPTAYISNGVDLTKFTYVSSWDHDNDFTIFVPRRMERKNGVHIFVQSLSRLTRPENGKNILVLITGDAPAENIDSDYANFVKEQAKALPDFVSIRFLGNLTPVEMNSNYGRSHLTVIPSLVEATSLSALEAMACGSILLASDTGGLTQLIKHGENGFLTKAGDEEALANNIDAIVSNFASLSKVRIQARRDIEQNYTWDEIARLTETIYFRE